MSKNCAKIVELMRRQDSSQNGHGNTVHRMFCPDERYTIDFADDFTSEGWEQFDTDQDAPYFGTWVNRSKLLTLTYAEGDWTLVVCPDSDHYNAEVRQMIEFYDEGFVFKTLDENGVTEYRQDRSQFLIPA